MITASFAKMKLVFVLSVLALYVSATPTGIVKDTKGRIFDAIPAEEGQFPYQVYIVRTGYIEGRQYECSGAILSKDWVITASGCLSTTKTTEIQAGSIFVSTKDDKRVIVEAEIYNRYNPKTLNIIGLFKLKTPLTFNAYIQPIRILKEDIEEDTILSFSGFSTIKYKGKSTNLLQHTTLKVMSEEDCKKAYPIFYDEYKMCASSRLRHTCKGDVGNPLVLNGSEPLLVGLGVVDYGDHCDKEIFASGFVKVYKYIDFIQNVTGIDL